MSNTEKPVRFTKKSAILAIHASGVTKASEILAALQAQGIETTINTINVTISLDRKAKAASEPTSSEG